MWASKFQEPRLLGFPHGLFQCCSLYIMGSVSVKEAVVCAEILPSPESGATLTKSRAEAEGVKSLCATQHSVGCPSAEGPEQQDHSPGTKATDSPELLLVGSAPCPCTCREKRSVFPSQSEDSSARACGFAQCLQGKSTRTHILERGATFPRAHNEAWKRAGLRFERPIPHCP